MYQFSHQKVVLIKCMYVEYQLFLQGVTKHATTLTCSLVMIAFVFNKINHN